MKVFMVESELNKEIYEHISKKYVVENDLTKLNNCSVVVISLVKNIKQALEIIDVALQNGIDVLCVKNIYCKESFVCNLLIKEGAMYI